MSAEDIEHRFTNHPPVNAYVGETLDSVTIACVRTGKEWDVILPNGREKALALTKLEEASMWAKAAIARNQEGFDA